MKIALFSGAFYYPSGGIEDFVGFFESVDEAIKAGQSEDNDWYQVVDVLEMQTIDSGSQKSCSHKKCQRYGMSYWSSKCPGCDKGRYDK